MFNYLLTQTDDQPIAWQQLNAFRHVEVVKTTCWSSNRASEWGRTGFKWLWTWLLVPDGLVWVCQKQLICWDLHPQPSLGLLRMVRKRENIQWKCLVGVRGQRRMGRLVPDDRKATGTQIRTHSNQGMQNILKKMGCSSRRPHRGPLLSANNRKLRLQFTQAHQNWTIEDSKNVAWSDESPFQSNLWRNGKIQFPLTRKQTGNKVSASSSR